MDSKPGLLLTSKTCERVIGDALTARFKYIRLWEAEKPDAILNAYGSTVVAMLTMGCDAALLERLPNLRLIATPGAGYDEIPVQAARARGITVASAGGVHSGEVADHAVTLALTSIQRLPEMQAYVREGHWLREGYFGSRAGVSGQRFGIVGLGNIGTAIAERLAPFGGDIAWWGPHEKDAPWPRCNTLAELAHWCTALIISTRGDVDTLITEDIIQAVGPEGLIVNIARGHVINEQALIAALKNGRLGKAALDVFAEEPAPPERWHDVPNTILSPHAAGLSHESIARVHEAAIQNLESVLDGEPVVHEVVI